MSPTDLELLSAFAESGDNDAFAALVRRRIDFVYNCALRQLGHDSHRAQDVVQDVFVKLAHHARPLSRHPALLGWLCKTTRFACLDVIRAEKRRRIREQEATAMHDHGSRAEPDWKKLQPVLDAALAELSDLDREVVLARHFERQSFAEIARLFGLSENAAQKRADRALDKLRSVLSRHQVTSTSAALGLALSHVPASAAPAGLAATVLKSALAAKAAGPAGALGALLFMTASKTALTLAGLGTLLCVGTAVLGVRAEQRAAAHLANSERELASLQRHAADLQQRAAAADRRVALANQQNAQLLAAAQASRSAPPAPPEELINSALVTQRLRRAQQLVVDGDPAEALRLLIWCYDVGMPRLSSMGSARTTLLLSFGRLGERYPPALDFLRARREQIRPRFQADPADTDLLGEYSMLNRALQDHAANLALLDQFPPGDRRRGTVLIATRDHLIDLRRYKEAAETQSPSSLGALFESLVEEPPLPPGTPDPERFRREQREQVIALIARNIEMLAGAGQLEDARGLAQRLLAYDSSDAARAALERHAARAGHPDFLARLSAP